MYCSITMKNHRQWIPMHRAIGKEIGKRSSLSGDYDEILSMGGIAASRIIDVFRPALAEEYIEFDRKQRGSCLNHDLYAYDPAQGVAIIQARMFYRRAAKHFGACRKTYFLCGQNEITKAYFRHPISAHTVRAACRKSTHNTRADVVTACQKWMWKVTDKQLSESTRQGDILLVPEKKPPQDAEYMGMAVSVDGSHQVLADAIRQNGRVYALNPRMIHTKNQHAPVELMDGWYSVRPAHEAPAWDFAERIGD